METDVFTPKESQCYKDISPLNYFGKNLILGRNTPILKKDSIKFSNNKNEMGPLKEKTNKVNQRNRIIQTPAIKKYKDKKKLEKYVDEDLE